MDDLPTSSGTSRRTNMPSTDIPPRVSQPDSSDDAPRPSSTSGTFECHICLDPAQNAVVSLCGHLFCWPCLYRWLETAKTCPVCKSAISADQVVPLYGRGSDHTRDPRSEVPPRPAGRRAEPENGSGPGFGGVFNNLFGTGMDVGGGGSNFRMSVGIGAFPYGLFATFFNLGGSGESNGNAGFTRHPTEAQWRADADALSKLCLFVAIFFMAWLLLA